MSKLTAIILSLFLLSSMSYGAQSQCQAQAAYTGRA